MGPDDVHSSSDTLPRDLSFPTTHDHYTNDIQVVAQILLEDFTIGGGFDSIEALIYYDDHHSSPFLEWPSTEPFTEWT